MAKTKLTVFYTKNGKRKRATRTFYDYGDAKSYAKEFNVPHLQPMRYKIKVYTLEEELEEARNRVRKTFK